MHKRIFLLLLLLSSKQFLLHGMDYELVDIEPTLHSSSEEFFTLTNVNALSPKAPSPVYSNNPIIHEMLLQKYAQNYNQEKFENIITQHHALINTPDEYQRTPLMCAISEFLTDHLYHLLKDYTFKDYAPTINVYTPNCNGYTPLHIAALLGNMSAIYLLRAYLQINDRHEEFFNCTPDSKNLVQLAPGNIKEKLLTEYTRAYYHERSLNKKKRMGRYNPYNKNTIKKEKD